MLQASAVSSEFGSRVLFVRNTSAVRETVDKCVTPVDSSGALMESSLLANVVSSKLGTE